MGVGGSKIKQLLSLLDLPHAKSYDKNAMYRVEEDVGKVLRAVAEKSIDEAIQEEIRLTLNEKHEVWQAVFDIKPELAGDEPLTYAKWLEIPSDERPRVHISVSFDMGWQQRGFSSVSGHAFMIGARSGLILAKIVCGKDCGVCKWAKKTMLR